MAHWNYRVVKDTTAGGGWVNYTVREVYYDDEGNPMGWSERAEPTWAQTPEELKDAYTKMAEAFDKEVLVIYGDKLV